MYKYHLTTIRLDSSVEWYTKDSETERHLKETYYDTNIMTVVDTVDSSEDVLVKEVTFSDIGQFYKFVEDPIVAAYVAQRKAYEEENNIIRFKQVIE